LKRRNDNEKAGKLWEISVPQQSMIKGLKEYVQKNTSGREKRSKGAEEWKPEKSDERINPEYHS